jgi:hypothetical protein
VKYKVTHPSHRNNLNSRMGGYACFTFKNGISRLLAEEDFIVVGITRRVLEFLSLFNCIKEEDS